MSKSHLPGIEFPQLLGLGNARKIVVSLGALLVPALPLGVVSDIRRGLPETYGGTAESFRNVEML